MREFLRRRGISFPLGVGKDTYRVQLRVGESKGVQDVERLDRTNSEIYAEMGRIIEAYPAITNGPLLGFENWRVGPDGQGNKELTVDASVLRYVTYMACHRFRAQGQFFDGEEYVALSVCGVVYDEFSDVFYLNRRPEDSQEDPGAIDAPGGVLNPELEPPEKLVQATARNRFLKKLGLEVGTLDCLGLMRIFDSTYSLYNFGMLGRVRGMSPRVDRKTFCVLPRQSVEDHIQNSTLMTSPAKAMLYMALQVI